MGEGDKPKEPLVGNHIQVGHVTSAKPLEPYTDGYLDSNNDRGFCLLHIGGVASDGSSGPLPKIPERQLTNGTALLAVFDGMGRNSKEASASFQKEIIDAFSNPNESLKNEEDFRRVVNIARRKHLEKTRTTSADTTATIAWVFEEDGVQKVALAQIGDSRAYVIHKDGTITQLTQDRNFISENLQLQSEFIPYISGIISNAKSRRDLTNQWYALPEDIRNAYLSLTKPVGDDIVDNLNYYWLNRNWTFGSRETPPEYSVYTIHSNDDKLVLTTDCLTDTLTTTQIEEIIKEHQMNPNATAQDLALRLQYEAQAQFKFENWPYERPKPDDLTILVIAGIFSGK